MDIRDIAREFLNEQGIDPKAKDQAVSALDAYLRVIGVDSRLAPTISKQTIDELNDPSNEINMPTQRGFVGKVISAVTALVKPKDPPPVTVEKEKDEAPLLNVLRPKKHIQQANEAVDIDRYTKDMVLGFLPPMNWWDKLPDWPVYSYTAIMMDQTRAAKKWIIEGLPNSDEIEAQIESRKYPYKTLGIKVLKKGKVDPASQSIVVGHELIQLADDKDTVKDTKAKTIDVAKGIITDTIQINTKYEPIAFPENYPEPYRDDLTDQKNPALDLLDTQRLVDEFLEIGKRIYDSQTENPIIFGFDDINSKYEKDKNIILANYKQYKANVRRMEYIHNIVENNSNKYLINKIHYRHDLTVCGMTEEYWTRYLREKLLAWYNETDDPETLIWKEHHWLPGEPGQVEKLLKDGEWKWYDNIKAGLEDSLARLEDLEATLDIIASMANALGEWQKYKSAIEEAEIIVEDPEWKGTVLFTDEIIDQTMLEDLLGVSEIVGSLGGEITPLRASLESARKENQAILEVLREMPDAFDAYPTIWSKLESLCNQVKADIAGPLNTLILDRRGDFETAGKHSSPSHLALDISVQLDNIVTTVQQDVLNIVQEEQKNLPEKGKHRLDSMLNKINEIRKWGPRCSIPFAYQVAIDNVNAAERLYNDIWSDVFDCWEREYITRVWRVVTEHHEEGVIPSVNYGKPIFTAECPHHLPLLKAPVPVAYRDIDIKYLSANCRKNFNFMTSWLTSTLYAIGVKRVALGNVINDSSLNGNDENIPYLDMLNELNQKNIELKDQMDQVIKSYNGTGELLNKADFDQIIAAKELSPTHYSNQTLLNMSTELHLLNTFPVTVLKLATNENRTGTTVANSEALKWDADINQVQSEKDAAGGTEVDVQEVKTIPTVGGPAEIVVDTSVTADDDQSSEGAYIGDIPEFEPWFYMTPDWDTQRALKDPVIVVPPETAPVIPGPQVIEDPVSPPINNNNVSEIAQPPQSTASVPLPTPKNSLTNREIIVENQQEDAMLKQNMIDSFRERILSKMRQEIKKD